MSSAVSLGFMGRFDMSIDTKGRLFLPPVFRGSFVDGGYLTTRLNKVVLYTSEGYTPVLAEVRALRDAGEMDRDTYDLLFGNSFPVQPDAQGRISIPKSMREEFGLDGPVTMLGTDECLSIFRNDVAPHSKVQTRQAAYELLNARGL